MSRDLGTGEHKNNMLVIKNQKRMFFATRLSRAILFYTLRPLAIERSYTSDGRFQHIYGMPAVEGWLT
jgi:hypothetical protein